MLKSWTCVGVEKGPGLLDESTRKHLMLEACGLRLRGKSRALIKGKTFTGIIIDANKSCCIGARSGNLFRAQIDIDGTGDCKINFLLSDEDLEKGAKTLKALEGGVGLPYTGNDLPHDLLQFYDLLETSGRMN